MTDRDPDSGFTLDDRDPRLFRHPQERLLTLRRPGQPDLKLTVMLAYVEGALRATVSSAQPFIGKKPAPPGSPPQEWAVIEDLVRDHFKAEAFDRPPTWNSRS